MANATVSRIGQANQAGDPLALFLKVFSGEVLAAFQETNVFLSRTTVRTITSGKSAQFPSTWKGTAGYHTPGTELVGKTVGHNERVITIDDLLVADRFVADIDEAMSHYDIRGTYAKDVGRALAQAMDKNIAQVGVLTARAAANITGSPGGTRIVSASMKTNADTIVGAIYDAKKALVKADVPQQDLYAYLAPDQYYLLLSSGSKAIQRELNSGVDNGSIAGGTLERIAGIPLVVSNNMPSTNVTTGPTAYQGDFTATAGLVMHKAAVGTVKLIDLKVRADYDPRRLGTLIVGMYASGHGILRPECAVELATA
jgi:hypothetical protein